MSWQLDGSAEVEDIETETVIGARGFELFTYRWI